VLCSIPQVYISSRTAKECEETAKELNALGPGKCISVVADMQKLSDVEKLVNEISSKEKALHVLVNNAGAAWGDKFDDYPVRPILQVSLMVVEFLVGLLGPRLDQSLDVEPSPSVHPYPEMLASPTSCRQWRWKRG
jgi:NAD(P)-dependent dehydrogenase (short-subunit alcohol dehydrogenase family)